MIEECLKNLFDVLRYILSESANGNRITWRVGIFDYFCKDNRNLNHAATGHKELFRPVNSRMKILGLITIRPGFVFEINEAGSAFIGLVGAVDIAINLRLIRKANKNFPSA